MSPKETVHVNTIIINNNNNNNSNNGIYLQPIGQLRLNLSYDNSVEKMERRWLRKPAVTSTSTPLPTGWTVS